MSEAGLDQGPNGTVGAELRAAREARELSVAQIAERTRIPSRHLSAIEDSDYAQLPAATYSAGFVRTYARLLGLDAQDLSRRFRAEIADLEPRDVRWEESHAPADPARVPSLGLAIGAVLIALVLVVGYLYWRGTQLENASDVAARSTPAEQPALKPDTAPPPSATDAQAASQNANGQPVETLAAPAAGETAVLTAEEPVWMRVTDGDAKLFEGMLKAGDHFQVPATATDPKLRTGRATVLKVTVGQRTIPALGPAETLIKDVSLKPDALVARTAPAQ